MMATPRGLAGSALLLGWAYGMPAAAQAPNTKNDAARAEALFDEARELMKKGRYAEACPKLEESNRLDSGLGTRMNLASCWDRTGHTAAAHREFLAVSESAAAKGERDRAEVARRHAAQLEPKLAKITILVPLENRVEGLEVRRDGSLLAPERWGTPELIDPGTIRIEARAPNRVAWHTELALSAGRAAEWTIPQLAPEPPTQAPAAGRLKPADSNANRDLWFRRAGVGATVVGVVGIGVGAYFGLRAKQLYDRSNEQGCNDDNLCPAPALRTRERAVDAGNVATVSFLVGTALTAGGVGLFVLGSREGATSLEASAAFAPDGSGQAVLHGRF